MNGNGKGLNLIQETFEAVQRENRAALMPYFTAGYPNPAVSLEILATIANSGADLIELGVPFSDPLADGPTIQRSTQVALENGTTLAGCLQIVSELRQRGAKQPLLLMGYYNPILAFGVERFVAEAARAGADGFIVPDLPPEEGGEMEAACQDNQVALIYLLAPTSTPERISAICNRASGFIYLVSLTGVTGARQALSEDLQAFIQRVRAQTRLPLAVGFGISTPEQAGQVGKLAQGVIVGSALINAVDGASDTCRAAGEFVRKLRDAL